MRTTLALLAVLLVPQQSWAWNGTGHRVVATIAWDSMTPAVRQRVIALLEGAPRDACLVDLMPADSRPLAARQREFFERASTWADIVRPGENDPRPCTRFHRGEWHYINSFWQGISGATGGDRPADRPDILPPVSNILIQLPLLRSFAACPTSQCGAAMADRAVALAWILHLVGDLHQPLHTNARITSRQDEQKGDQGGNLFLLEAGDHVVRLHGYWDGILDRSAPRNDNEAQSAYIARLAAAITRKHPRGAVRPQLRPANYDAWAREGFETTKAFVYPATLKRGELPSHDYEATAFTIAQEAIAKAGYRLGNLLNRMFG